jgi:SAM-dependent methyltransferase
VSREHWERQAANWAAWARTPGFDAYWTYSPKFFELVPEPRGLTLEVGCGEGRVTRDLAKRGHHVVAVDAIAPLIRLARDADSANHYLRCDAAALPFGDRSFDLVVFYNSLMDVDDMQGAVREAARVLRQGGAMCSCVTHPIADAGRFESTAAGARFVIEDTYLGSRRWLHIATVERDGLRMDFSGWAYPLETYFAALEQAGFQVQALREPPVEDSVVAREADEKRWRRIPLFLMWRAVKM